ncbi:MAG TPA: hypothetical protein VF173_27645 [Thermoanaerobaculia bacterium]|nr:hypothetical protein [Thermoanaerobaculia bacterium]
MSDASTATRPEAAAIAWNWRERAGVASSADGRAREARALRIRGLVGGAIGLAFAALLYFVGHKVKSAEVVAGIAVLLAVLALVAPLTVFKKISHGLDVFARGVATAVTWVLMTILFYVVFLPIGLILRAGKKLAITKGADPRLSSYWISTEGQATPLESYRRQF